MVRLSYGKTTSFLARFAILGLVGIVATVAVLAVNPFQPQNFSRPAPEDLRSPQVSSVWVGFYDAGGNSVDSSQYGRKASMGVGYDNQIGANDCCYWTGNHIGHGHRTWHTDVGYNSYSRPGFVWYNWGSGYDDFEIEVERLDNGDGFTGGGSEDATITFTGGDDWALVEPSDDEVPSWAPLPGAPAVFDSTTYYVPVFYNTYVWLNGHR